MLTAVDAMNAIEKAKKAGKKVKAAKKKVVSKAKKASPKKAKKAVKKKTATSASKVKKAVTKKVKQVTKAVKDNTAIAVEAAESKFSQVKEAVHQITGGRLSQRELGGHFVFQQTPKNEFAPILVRFDDLRKKTAVQRHRRQTDGLDRFVVIVHGKEIVSRG